MLFAAHHSGEAIAHPQARIVRIATYLHDREAPVIALWIMLVVTAAAVKAATAPTPAHGIVQILAMTLPFLALAAAPVCGYRIAARLFPEGGNRAQPALRLARYGSWREATESEAANASRSGPGLAFVSLVVGTALNVPVRALEFLTIFPAVAPSDPAWVHALMLAFTVDVVAMCFVYTACFVAASRLSPLFPRALVMAWILDMAMQLLIAIYLGTTTHLPAEVAAPMTAMLIINIKKVAISAVIWAPYLLLSDRLNLLLRNRVRVA